MNITTTSFTIADYCAAMERKEIRVNRDYQRSDQVWPPAAKSFLIETILLGYPIPKLSLYQVTDLKSRKTFKEIVDGQQRSEAILEFFKDDLRLSKRCAHETAAGKKYSDLEKDDQQRFLDYALSLDLFVSAAPDEIRETFRRINSYTVPLNPEEQRHAKYQGAFKWFVYELCKEIDQNLLDMGVFTQKQLIRMADAKLLSEFTHAIVNGIKTTKKNDLEALYRDNEADFPKERKVRERTMGAIDFILKLPEVHNGPLMKPHVFYSLVLAVSHTLKPAATLLPVFDAPKKYSLNKDIVAANLSKLAEALEVEEDQVDEKYAAFYSACSDRTNVAEQRKTRFKTFCIALQPKLF